MPSAATAAPFAGFPKSGVSWFRALAIAQRREWFQENRDGYESLWLQPMTALLTEIRAPLGRVFGRALGSTKIFRLNRDVRFSKDKSPYKTHIAALIPFAGFAPMEGPAALYLHLGLDEAVAFGFYMLESDALKRLRLAVLDDKRGRVLERIVDRAELKGLELDGMEKLKRGPAGVDPKHPRIELLRYKGLALSSVSIPKSVRYGAELKGWIIRQAVAAAPLMKWGFKAKLA